MNLNPFELPGIIGANNKYIVFDPKISPEIEKSERWVSKLALWTGSGAVPPNTLRVDQQLLRQ